MARRLLTLTALSLAAGLLLQATPQAQGLTLRLRRTFGYSFGRDIQGSFELIADGPPELTVVRFYVDETLLGTATEPPYRARLHTGDYANGVHELKAEGELRTSEPITSNTIEVNFVSAEAGIGMVGSLLTPVLVILGLALGGTALFVALSSRRYRPGVYGISGGAVCPRCRLPMSRHWLSPHLITGKLERCPHCGKWSFVRRASAEELAQAEARLAGDTTSVSGESHSEGRLQRQIDDSRYVE